MKEEFKYCPLCGTKLSSGDIENKIRQYCTNCDFIDYKNPLPVAVAMATRDKKFLLIKRGIEPRKGMWGSASGFIEICWRLYIWCRWMRVKYLLQAVM
jgi:8-oxo-dGTP diphosphatase